MAYNQDLPANTTAPTEIRENFRALKDDKIVAAATAITAESAVKLANARTIFLAGDATGSATFDGSADMSILVDVISADTAAACTGNAASATKLETARTINGVSFDGTADITITEVNGKTIATTDQIQNAFSNIVVDGITIHADRQMDTLELAAGTNIALNADTINEKVTIGVTGKVANAVQADSATVASSCTGNSATATKLSTVRKINGVLFDGSADITITQVNGKDIAITDEIPTSLPANGGDADTVDGKHAVDFAPAGYVPPNATETTDGSMSAADKTKLDGIEAGAQVNQNAFSNMVINGTMIHADSQTDTIEFAGGTNIALTPDVTSEKITIAITGKVASAAQADTATNAAYATSAGNADTLDGHHWSEVQTAITANNFDAGHSFNTNGYQKLASGLIIQWGSWSVVPGTVYFPTSFPNVCLSVSFNGSGSSGFYGYALSAYNITKTTFNIAPSFVGQAVTNSWFAIGY
jgi:hypothetical protein